MKKRDYVELIERTRKLVDDLNRLKDNKYFIIVEGKRDKAALENLGLTLPIICYNDPGFHNNIIESDFQKVIILTDWDAEGKELNRRIRIELENYGIFVDDYYRKRSREIFKYFGDTIEGLNAKLSRIYKEISGLSR